MSLTYELKARPAIATLAAAIAAVALLACENPTATPQPTTTTAPTATQAPTPTESMPGPEGTTVPSPTATVAPTVSPTKTYIVNVDCYYVCYLLEHRGYKPEWGEPWYGGIYKTADPRPASAFQTTLGYGAFSQWQFAAHNSLMMMDPWGEITDAPICDLCESFEVSADGLTYTFRLRDYVQFHEEGWAKDQGAPGFGTELVCEDIKASHEWFANPPPETRASYVRTGQFYMGHLDEVTCPDGPDGKYAVMNFDRVRNGTLGWLAAGIAVWDKDYREWMDAEYPGVQSTAVPEGYLINMGTGPFIPTSADSQTVMKSRKNRNYWINQAPFIDGMDNYAIPDQNTRFAALLTGKIHQAGHGSIGLTWGQMQQVQDKYSDMIELHLARGDHQQHFLMNHLRPPFDNWNVRHAVQLALDRGDWQEYMIAGDVWMADPYLVLHPNAGWGIPVEEFQTFPGMNPATKDADIAEANRLLDEAFGQGVIGLAPTSTSFSC